MTLQRDTLEGHSSGNSGDFGGTLSGTLRRNTHTPAGHSGGIARWDTTAGHPGGTLQREFWRGTPAKHTAGHSGGTIDTPPRTLRRLFSDVAGHSGGALRRESTAGHSGGTPNGTLSGALSRVSR
jgi:hypothetical protein